MSLHLGDYISFFLVPDERKESKYKMKFYLSSPGVLYLGRFEKHGYHIVLT